LFSAAFVDVRATCRLGNKVSAFEIFHQGSQILLEVSLEHGDALPIDSCGSSVLPYRLKRLVHQRESDASGQRMVLDFAWFCAVDGLFSCD
jgi:hypothetical protein